MCGIYLTNIPFAEEEIKGKLESIQFRGPDYTGIQKITDLTFGHLRLSILDLDVRSHQPMQFEDFTIVFNGEIYNFQEIKKELMDLGYAFNTTGDTEVLLKGYKEWGEGIVPKLNGMFAFAIYNAATRKIFCSRDRLGVKPFYYFWKDGQFEICSQLRPMSQNKQLNEEAISMYLDCTYVPSPFTIYQDVYKLSPGNNLEIDLNTQKITIKEYWNLKKVSDAGLSYEEAKEQLHELLKDAVKIRLQADVPFGSFLSGGIDSALISSIAAKVSKEPIKTFSIGFEDPKYDESKIAAQYAKIMGSEHTETICKPEDILELIPKLIEVYDEPFADSSALPSLLLNKITQQYVTMALSGDGGDESFLGYNNFDWVAKFKSLTKIPYPIRFIASKFLIFNVLGSRTEPIKRILNIKSKNDFIEGIFVGYNSILKKRNLDWLSHYRGYQTWSKDLIQATADLNIKLWLENDSNVKVDRASMAYSVEVRSPFLDYRIIEFARTLAVSYRYVPGRKKRILRDILKEYIPEEVFNQPKRGFAVPIGTWIRKELKEEFIENLSDDFLNQVPNLNVPKFKKMFKVHLEGKHDYASYIWRVYILSKWYQEFGFYKKTKVD
ncbi:asparagine synthase (glutamine-hydrolyzing) [Flavobacterium sp.]|uniref:asparagine synthase (glutamine-hydrolyzing) n=1 Tax=Flavobacterium sp. TaxID=239 RepID=UPI002B4AD964|nr:asparagine synthase (glutamine-hydrolyzing) [Flavobacterium sp.]HLF51303.1 asparagine synthase (glutamine-hydrolyzing) [Flavobacterium sp.]